MNPTVQHLVPLLVALHTGACADPATSVAGRSDDELVADLLARIADDHTWDQPPAWEGTPWITAGSPHGTWVDIRVHPIGADVLGRDPMPYGTVLTKTQLDAPDAPSGVVNAMWKLRGLDRDDGAWFWAQWVDDRLETAGPAVHECLGCHRSGADFIRSAVDAPGVPPA